MQEDNNKWLKYLLPVRCIIFLLIFIIISFVTKRNVSEFSNCWSIIATIVNIVLILFLLIATKRNNSSFRELINYQKGVTKPKQIVLVSLLIFFVGMFGMYLAGFVCYDVIPYAAPMLIAPIPIWTAILNVLLLPVTTALAEDGLYLGCGVNQIQNNTAAIFVPAFFFALQHSFIPTLFDLRYIIYRFISFLPLTIILCIYYHKRRNPLPIMIGHGIIDVATVMQILATSTIPGFYDMMCGL